MSAQVMPRPEQKEIVTKAILAVIGLNTESFSGSRNPTQIWRQLTANGPDVFPLYRELLRKDWEVASAYETRKILLLAREAKVQAAGREPRAQEYATEAQRWLDTIPDFNFALEEMADAIGYGYKVLEILWAADGGDIFLGGTRLVGRPGEIFRFAANSFEPQTGELHLANFPGGAGQAVPTAKFVVATHKPADGDRRGMPLLRDVFWPSWLKRNALPLWMRFLERGRGTTVVKYPQGSSDEEQNKALEAAAAIAEAVYAAVPENFGLLAETLGNTRTFDANDFNVLTEKLDAGITRRILGQSLSTRGQEQGKGAFALGDVHLQVLFEYIRRDATVLENPVNDQLLAPWLLMRFGPEALRREVRPWWTVDKKPPKDLTRILDLVLKARSAGMEVPRAWAHEQAQVPMPETDERGKTEDVLPPNVLDPIAMVLPEDRRPPRKEGEDE